MGVIKLACPISDHTKLKPNKHTASRGVRYVQHPATVNTSTSWFECKLCSISGTVSGLKLDYDWYQTILDEAGLIDNRPLFQPQGAKLVGVRVVVSRTTCPSCHAGKGQECSEDGAYLGDDLHEERWLLFRRDFPNYQFGDDVRFMGMFFSYPPAD